MSVYDSKDLMSFNAASREFDVPAAQLELAASRGALRVIQLDNGQDDGQVGSRWLLRPDVEQFVKRTIKRGAATRSSLASIVKKVIGGWRLVVHRTQSPITKPAANHHRL